MPFVSTAIAIGTAVGVGGGGFLAGAAGYGIAAGSIYGATKGVQALAGGDKPKQITSSAGSPSADLAAAQQAAAQTAKDAQSKRAKAIARSRTVYTTPLGLSTEADVAKKTLTGV